MRPRVPSDSPGRTAENLHQEDHARYDDRDQLISASHTYAAYLVDESYAYDPTGNRTESHLHGGGYSTAADNRLESDGTYWYLFDNEGNVTEKRLGSDTGTLVARYTWDHRNRLTLVEIFDESTGDPLRTVGYAYDTFDRRISRFLDEGSDSSIDDRDFYYYDGADVALVLDENLEVEHRRLFGPAVDMILADETRDPSTGDLEDVYWALADHQGTVRDVATFDSGVTTHFEHVETDSYGRIVEVTHDIGGVAVVDSSNTPTLAYVYTGREWDPVVQLAYHINRWYDPGVGRWLSQDPLGFGADDTNFYGYVWNSPANYFDPFGLDGFWADAWGIAQYVGNGLKNVGKGAVNAAKEVVLAPIDAVVTIGDAASTYCGYPLYTQNLSASGQYQPESMTDAVLESGVRGVRVYVAVETVGASEILIGTAVYVETGDAEAFQQHMGALALGNCTGALILRGSQAQTAQSKSPYGSTPEGRPFTKHYGTETGPQRNIPGSVVDNTINTTKGVPGGNGTTVHYDPANNVTVVTGDGGSIVSARRGSPPKGQ